MGSPVLARVNLCRTHLKAAHMHRAGLGQELALFQKRRCRLSVIWWPEELTFRAVPRRIHLHLHVGVTLELEQRGVPEAVFSKSHASTKRHAAHHVNRPAGVFWWG